LDERRPGFAASSPGLPVVGQVAVDSPCRAEENIEEYVQTPPFAGGEDGDYLPAGCARVDERRRASSRATLVVVKPQMSRRMRRSCSPLVRRRHVKRFFQEADHVRLQPENESMERSAAAYVRVIARSSA